MIRENTLTVKTISTISTNIFGGTGPFPPGQFSPGQLPLN